MLFLFFYRCTLFSRFGQYVKQHHQLLWTVRQGYPTSHWSSWTVKMQGNREHSQGYSTDLDGASQTQHLQTPIPQPSKTIGLRPQQCFQPLPQNISWKWQIFYAGSGQVPPLQSSFWPSWLFCHWKYLWALALQMWNTTITFLPWFPHFQTPLPHYSDSSEPTFPPAQKYSEMPESQEPSETWNFWSTPEMKSPNRLAW